ncbi:hypothetical protein LTS18_009252 [Coniosporium uncinatum]|uniref:Uncharacterized protein n=1 Tax=Coniosporium uncinatum TaxID=93489 RepID=A0ACC3DCV1_9PEZI|nr:hypothetical protein LTS18_009252 [Coniosporium uncinatum]
MLTQKGSPTARLLRSSRLFSLPPPLPEPKQGWDSRDGRPFVSETATTHYPTRQAIATTDSSRSRGDWGLKRPLPRRMIADRTNPTLRITAQDTVEHITDFEPANDHTQTVEKWQEMNVAFTQQVPRNTMSRSEQAGALGAYEARVDNTDPERARENAEGASGLTSPLMDTLAPKDQARWKFEGPSISTMDESAFKRFVHNTKSSRMDEFQKFLRNKILEKVIQTAEQDLRTRAVNEPDEPLQTSAEGQTPDLDEVGQSADSGGTLDNELRTERGSEQPPEQEPDLGETWVSPDDIARLSWEERVSRTKTLHPHNQIAHVDIFTLEEKIGYFVGPERVAKQLVSDRTKMLRGDTTLKSPLAAYIREFLDLPPLHGGGEGARSSSSSLPSDAASDFNSAAEGKAYVSPTTHPAAGLSYLRSNAYIENHPLLGPQASPTPVSARVLQIKDHANNQTSHPYLGVGGIVTEGRDYALGSVEATQDRREPSGGQKVWAQPESAFVDAEGRIRLKLAKPDNHAISVKKGASSEDEAKYMAANKRPQIQPFDVPSSGPDRIPRSGVAGAAGRRAASSGSTIASINQVLAALKPNQSKSRDGTS